MSSTTTTTTEILPASSTSISPAMSASTTYGRINYVPANHNPTPSPHNFHLPTMSEFSDSRTVPLHDLRPLPTVSQLATAKAQLSTHAFTALKHPSALHSPPYSYTSWKDPHLLQQIYIPETEELVKHVTGARTVVTEALLLRSVVWTEEDALATHAGHGSRGHQQDDKTQMQTVAELEPKPNNPSTTAAAAAAAAATAFPQFIGFSLPGVSGSEGGASPAPKVHQDYTPNGARTHIRSYHPSLRSAAQSIITAEEEEEAALLPPHPPPHQLSSQATTLSPASPSPPLPPPRWALYSIWRPLKRVRRDALALCDARSVRAEEYVPIMVRTPTLGVAGAGAGSAEGNEVHDCEAWVARAGGGHDWHWVSDQKPEEVLVIGLFDSACEGKGEGTGAGGALHCSVELVGTAGVEEARESLELRCLAIW